MAMNNLFLGLTATAVIGSGIATVVQASDDDVVFDTDKDTQDLWLPLLVSTTYVLIVVGILAYTMRLNNSTLVLPAAVTAAIALLVGSVVARVLIDSEDSMLYTGTTSDGNFVVQSVLLLAMLVVTINLGTLRTSAAVAGVLLLLAYSIFRLVDLVWYQRDDVDDIDADAVQWTTGLVVVPLLLVLGLGERKKQIASNVAWMSEGSEYSSITSSELAGYDQ